MKDRTIQNTFNAFWSMKWGKDAKPIDFTIMRYLCRAERDADLKDIMMDIMNAFRPWIDKEEPMTKEDFIEMIDAANVVFKKYIYHRDARFIIESVFDYIDRRETRNANYHTNN